MDSVNCVIIYVIIDDIETSNIIFSVHVNNPGRCNLGIHGTSLIEIAAVLGGKRHIG